MARAGERKTAVQVLIGSLNGAFTAGRPLRKQAKPRSHRYRITPIGAPVAIFHARLYARALRPASSLQPQGPTGAQRAFDRLDAALATFLVPAALVALTRT